MVKVLITFLKLLPLLKIVAQLYNILLNWLGSWVKKIK